jgi:DNA-binding NtrC family response regulator
MNLNTQTAETSTKTSFSPRLKQNGRRETRILIVSEDDSIADRLVRALPESGFIWERARSITAGCTCAKSGRFQVILTTPLSGDGSWRRLVDIATHYDLGFVVILVATAFDIQEWGEALEYGAFDVLDGLDELPKVAESAKGAAWAAYLKGVGHRTEAISPLRAA